MRPSLDALNLGGKELLIMPKEQMLGATALIRERERGRERERNVETEPDRFIPSPSLQARVCIRVCRYGVCVYICTWCLFASYYQTASIRRLNRLPLLKDSPAVEPVTPLKDSPAVEPVTFAEGRSGS